MKIIWLILATLVLVGCTPQKPAAAKPDPIKALEARIEIQQQQIFKLQSKQSNTLEFFASMLKTMRQTDDTVIQGMQNLSEGMQNLKADLKLYESHMKDTNAHPPTRIRYVAAPYQAPATVAKPPALTRGVPAAVFNNIKAAAEREWPGNFEMQEFTIKNQVEAYKKVNP